MLYGHERVNLMTNFTSQHGDILFDTNALTNNSQQQHGSPRGKVLRKSQNEHDPSFSASVTSDRTRRSSTRYKEDEGLEDQHQHGQSKPPVRKKGKTGSSDNRWSKRFTWPDAVRPFNYCNFPTKIEYVLTDLFVY